ncbi:effector-associated constant component EACC1 [Streptomyces sp. NEAU-Y11]|uniref:effector-associated constant component EACC1 n=1 Tax=Streptomyces cucumeris TaxID=2962890 RepID=UPI0035AB9C37
MDIFVRCTSREAEAELRSLAAWIGIDRTLRPSVRAKLGSARPKEAGHQGNSIDILSLVLSSGFSAASLAASIATWRSTRPQRPNLTVVRSDGVMIQISGPSDEEAHQLLQRALGE